VLTKTEAAQVHIISALDLKTAIDLLTKKISRLDIIESSSSLQRSAVPANASESDDDDFIEVKSKEWHELQMHEQIPQESRLKEHAHRFTESRPEPSQQSSSTEHVTTKKESEDVLSSSWNTRRNELLEKAPVVPYGNDLYHWGVDIEAPLVQRNESDSHRWWAAQAPDETVDIRALDDIKHRVIDFPGKFEPVKWKCRAPLSTGRLCQRMDRKKCPFHGLIIARDERGRPKESRCTDEVSKESQQISDEASWEDPELQAEILAATGIDVSRKGKQKLKKSSQRNGLTDIKLVHKNTGRKRLETKVFNSSTMKRVADSLSKFESKRIKDKFSSNFNYTFNS
jgi:hypothetical protein